MLDNLPSRNESSNYFHDLRKPQLTACFSRLRKLCNEKSTGPSIDLLRGDLLLMVTPLRSLIEKAREMSMSRHDGKTING